MPGTAELSLTAVILDVRRGCPCARCQRPGVMAGVGGLHSRGAPGRMLAAQGEAQALEQEVLVPGASGSKPPLASRLRAACSAGRVLAVAFVLALLVICGLLLASMRQGSDDEFEEGSGRPLDLMSGGIGIEKLGAGLFLVCAPAPCAALSRDFGSSSTQAASCADLAEPWLSRLCCCMAKCRALWRTLEDFARAAGPTGPCCSCSAAPSTTTASGACRGATRRRPTPACWTRRGARPPRRWGTCQTLRSPASSRPGLRASPPAACAGARAAPAVHGDNALWAPASRYERLNSARCRLTPSKGLRRSCGSPASPTPTAGAPASEPGRARARQEGQAHAEAL